jgi:hypothetical protein
MQRSYGPAATLADWDDMVSLPEVPRARPSRDRAHPPLAEGAHRLEQAHALGHAGLGEERLQQVMGVQVAQLAHPAL